MNRIIVLRHAQTDWNNAGRFQGTVDIALNESGREQATVASAVIAQFRPSFVISSDLRRAFDTATAVAQLLGLDVTVDKRLRERAYGPWEGLTRDEVKQQFPDEFVAWQARQPFHLPGMETQKEVADRGKAVLSDVGSKLDSQTAVVVGHGGALRQAIAAFLGWEPSQADTIRGLANCHWSDLRHGNAGWLMYGYNVGANPAPS